MFFFPISTPLFIITIHGIYMFSNILRFDVLIFGKSHQDNRKSINQNAKNACSAISIPYGATLDI